MTGPAADTTRQFIVQWLARAADDPEKARDEWTDEGVALLRCGRRFSVVRIPAELVHAAMGGADFTADDLRFHLGGPAIHDEPEGWYWALIHGYCGLVWDEGEDVPTLGDDHYLGVPALARTRPPGLHWAVPPRFDGDVCPLETLRRFIAYGRKRLASVEA